MKKLILLVLASIGLYLSAYAQRTCGSELNLEQIKQNEPERYQRFLEIEKFISERISSDNQRIRNRN